MPSGVTRKIADTEMNGTRRTNDGRIICLRTRRNRYVAFVAPGLVYFRRISGSSKSRTPQLERIEQELLHQCFPRLLPGQFQHLTGDRITLVRIDVLRARRGFWRSFEQTAGEIPALRGRASTHLPRLRHEIRRRLRWSTAAMTEKLFERHR